MKRLLLLLALAFPVFAARTTVTGTLMLGNGAFCSGTLSISNPPFTSIDGFVAGGSFTSPINAATGSFSVSLEPGPYYTVTYVTAPSGCTPPVEFWSVPVSGTPVDVSVVRSVAPPPPLPNTIPLSYITQSAATTGQCATWNGTNWAPASSCGTGLTTLTIGTTTITSGTTTRILYDNAGVLGEYPIGSGVATALSLAVSGSGAICLATGSSCAGAGDVVGPASSTDNAIARFDSTTGKLIQNSVVTVSDAGNISTAGSLSAGVGSGNAGAIELTQGSAPSLGTTSVLLYAPASVTSYAFLFPAAAATGVLHATNAANIDTLSISSVVSADLNITTTTCTNQFLTALGATGLGTCTTDTLASAQHANQGTTTTLLHGNAGGNPSWTAVSLTADITGTLAAGNGGTGITSLGTGVATALGTAVSGTGAICLASGSACSGGATNIDVGTSTISSGTTTRILYDNGGLVGEYTLTGTGTVVAMATSPSFTTPALGTPTALVCTSCTGTATGLTSGITNALKSATTTVDVSAATAPTSGQVLTATAGTTATWQTPSGGSPSPYGYNFVAIVNANWTTIGAGGTRTNTTNNGPSGGPTIALASATGGSGSIYGVTATVAAGDFTRYAQFWPTSALAVDFTTVGFGVTDGTKSEYAQLIYISSSGTAIRSGKASALAAGTYAAANGDTNNLLLVGTAGGVWNTPVLLKINRTGTTYTGSYSVDGGANYITVFSDTTPYLTATSIIVLTDARGGANAGKLTLFSCSDGAGTAC